MIRGSFTEMARQLHHQARGTFFRLDRMHRAGHFHGKRLDLLRADLQFRAQKIQHIRLRDFPEIPRTAPRRKKFLRDLRISGILQHADHAGVDLGSVHALFAGVQELGLERKLHRQCDIFRDPGIGHPGGNTAFRDPAAQFGGVENRRSPVRIQNAYRIGTDFYHIVSSCFKDSIIIS